MDAIEIRDELDDEVSTKLLLRLRKSVLSDTTAWVPTAECLVAVNLIASAAIAERDRRWCRMARAEIDRAAARLTPYEEHR